jgi:signal transduction histidine kinase
MTYKKLETSPPASAEVLLAQMESARQSLMEPLPPPSDHLTGQLQQWMDAVRALDREYTVHAKRAQADFVSFVAHELRTPMTSIRGYADMLAQGVTGPISSEQAQFLHTIIRNTERLQILISDLQDITRIESDRMNLEIKTTSLAAALKSASENVRGLIEERAQQLTMDVPDDLPSVSADPKRLEQILTELLRNASKYTRPNERLRVRVWLQAQHVHCAVSDAGIGISPADQAQLFTPFFRSEEPAVREMHGTGLGLCIIKYLVERQGGELTIESVLGQGTIVTFTVPIATYH